ncbi:MAG: class I SAM-dependent methyltransferase [Rickettsiales bacterium]|nr:class I SAM-dependent methyltransferase [Rickettsiales bacterium]
MIEIYISKKASDEVRAGFPWVYNSEILKNSMLETLEAGELVKILDNKGKFLSIGYFNYKSIISIRILNQNSQEKIDKDFFKTRIKNAVKKREKFSIKQGNFNTKFCRLIFGEADFLPGFIVDSYGDYLSCEITTMGAFKLKQFFLDALSEISQAKGLIISINPSDKSEFLQAEKFVIGEIPEIIEIQENGIFYYANLQEGQKTGWFYDQRRNRGFLTSYANDKNFLDLFSHSGGFGVLAGVRGAKNIFMVDSSELALGLAKISAKKNNILEKCKFIKQDAFDFLNKYNPKDEIFFDIISADPPAFIKAKKYVESGMKGYEKLVQGCLNLFDFQNVSDEKKYFALTSCSHHAEKSRLKKVAENVILREAKDLEYKKLKCELIADFSADIDHTPHPKLAKTNYLKFLCWGIN